MNKEKSITQKMMMIGMTSTGEKIPLLVGEDGQILQSAYFETVIIEAPNVNTKINVDEGTINTASSKTLALGNMTVSAYLITVSNDNETNGDNLKIYLYGLTGFYYTVKAGETITIDNQKFSSVIIKNDSPNTISYRIIVQGV